FATLEVVSRTSLAAVGLFRFLRDRGYELRLYRFSAIRRIQAFSTDPDRNALSDIGPAFDSQRAGLSPLLPVVCWLCLYHLGAADFAFATAGGRWTSGYYPNWRWLAPWYEHSAPDLLSIDSASLVAAGHGLGFAGDSDRRIGRLCRPWAVLSAGSRSATYVLRLLQTPLRRQPCLGGGADPGL